MRSMTTDNSSNVDPDVIACRMSLIKKRELLDQAKQRLVALEKECLDLHHDVIRAGVELGYAMRRKS